MSDLASRVAQKHSQSVQDRLDQVARFLEERSIRISGSKQHGYSVSLAGTEHWSGFATLEDAAQFARGISTQVENSLILLAI